MIFILTLIAVFLTFLVESVSLYLQLSAKKLTRWFGKYDFSAHALITIMFWTVMCGLIAVLQSEKHPLLHYCNILKYAGFIIFLLGLVLATWGFLLLGPRRSLGLNFFKSIVSIVLILGTMLVLRDPIFPKIPFKNYGLLLLSGAVGIGAADTLLFASLNRLGAGLSGISKYGKTLNSNTNNTEIIEKTTQSFHFLFNSKTTVK